MMRLLLMILAAASASAQTFAGFEVSPPVAVKGVTDRIRLRAEDGFDCRNEPVWCGVASITIGGVPAPSFEPTELYAEWEALIPDLPAGTIADVVVIDRNGNMRRRNGALRIVGPGDPFSPDAFDRVLIPLIFEGPGQKGSQWMTDVWLMNAGRYEIPFLGGAPAELVRNQRVKLDTAAPAGHVLYPAKNATDDLAVNILVRDLSRQGEALGTELPAVRERELRNARVLLLNVPSDPRFRLTLRIYALDRLPLTDTMTYWLHEMEGGEQATFGTIALQPPATGQAPWSASIDLMAAHPEIANRGPLRLTLQPLGPHPAARYWAFISVTNNETQHVTAITPNP
jgi:hypothetical protein